MTLELRKPRPDRLTPGAAADLHVLRIAASDLHVPATSGTHHNLWDTYFARLLLSLLAVALSFSSSLPAIEQRGWQLDGWMRMTEAMAELSGKVQPEVQQHRTATESAKLAVQLIADRSRAIAAGARDLAQATFAAELPPSDWGQTK